MGNVIDAMTIVRSLRNGHENPVGARRFRSVLVTSHVLDAGMEWTWDPPELGDDAFAGLVFAQGGLRLGASDGGLDPMVPDAGHFLHPRRVHRLVGVESGPVACIWLPWSALVEIEDGVRSPSSVIAATPLSSGLRAFLTAILTQPAAPTQYTDYLVERSLVEMVFGVLIEVAAKGVATGREPRAIDRARSLMLIRREDPDFNIGELAAEMHMSTRHLQRLFAEEKSSPADELRRTRVELAKELLNDPTYAPLSVEEIALHSGFGTAAGLRRAFAAFGLPSPAHARRTGPAAA
ncbi:AraC-like DNA-binding protein [Microbacterium resistens]|uniref:AraC-like DNA-binding protein n=1 Tax=Microbacterium resistens TaxID=156977 RepID=A0ABU1SCH7_9MICO|nr:helix-turn-helix domain-containing protein [Microbacterium resistens]MDR6867259.1 AraC-like DNA-binding protein [Microbacterium resistens]